MDNGETLPLLTADHILNLNNLLPSTSMMASSDNSEIDWVTLLAGSFNFGDQNPSQPMATAGENHNGANKNKKKGGKAKKSTPQRIAFHTRSKDDILDDGYRWRKYGQKAVKNSVHQRSYYRCTQHTCNVKKQIQRLSKDSSIVVTTYEGIHNHPCEKVMETLSPLLRQLQFLSRF